MLAEPWPPDPPARSSWDVELGLEQWAHFTTLLENGSSLSCRSVPHANPASNAGTTAAAPRTLGAMSVVRINAIEVPEGMGPTLEERFAKRLGAVDTQPGFEGFELLRPTGEAESRYFVMTHWATAEHFDAWVSSQAFGQGHAGPPAGQGGEGGNGAPPVATGSAVLEFDVVARSVPEA
jgi:heme-degrading monooxygenase HmoA